MVDIETKFQMLIEAVRLLAADFEVQVVQFPDFVEVADEIALTYYDCSLFIRELLDSHVLKKDHAKQLKSIDDLLDEMSKEKEFWTLDSLRDNVAWRRVRQMARQVLVSLNQNLQQPDLFWIKYIKG